ncbi:hypothetical protein [Bacillus thuringiensis]|uniref:hypothetical protein n=1 Tax=Bacillus thuringiensis TaxID=1428 RepID=UPI00298D0644|nr:hypothetical protein [Bacillus thuringiensis]
MEELLNLSLLRTGGLDINLSDESENPPIPSEQVAIFKYDPNQRNKASFELNSEYKWVIDTNYFTGNPKLEVKKTKTNKKEIIEICLNDACYPGTNIPADFSCKVEQSCTGSVMQLCHLNEEFYCKVSLEDWLTNQETAHSTISLSQEIFHFHNTSCNITGNEARVEFFPNWSINLIGKGLAEFSHSYDFPHKDFVTADKVRIELPNPTAKSLFLNPSSKRTKIFISPTQEQTWIFHEELGFGEGWKIKLPLTNRNLFDQIYVEANVDQHGKESFLILARPNRQKKGSSLTFSNQDRVSPSLLIPFQSLYYILSFAGRNLQRLIMGKFSFDGGWCHSYGCSVLLGDRTRTSAKLLELDFNNFTLKRAIIEPAVLAIAAPLQGTTTKAEWSGTLNSSVILMNYPNRNVERNIQEQIQIELKRNYPAPIIRIPENLCISIIRPKDLLALKFEFINLAFICRGIQGKAPYLQRIKKKDPSYLIVHFPPQHIGEEVFNENQSITQPIRSRLSEPSRLVFKLPDKSSSILYSLDKLLNWKYFEQSVSPRAITLAENVLTDFSASTQSKDISTVEPPSIEHTAIEAPYRLIISPNSSAGWAHAFLPVANKGITELWHTRLGVRDGTNIDENDNILRTIRAIWSRYEEIANPFNMSLEHYQRKEIVNQTAVQTPDDSNSCLPVPVNVKRLMLTSLGIWMDVQGDWSPDNCKISNWEHQTAMGRDSYVKIVTEGYLLPLGNLASLIQVTERKFRTEKNETIAYLEKRYFVVVRELEKDYSSTGITNIEYKCPIKKVTFLTRITPNITIDCDPQNPTCTDDILIKVGNQPFKFQIIAEDYDGKKFSMPTELRFLSQKTVSGDLGSIVSGYEQSIGMGGQKISYAKSRNGEAGETTFETKSFTFGAEALPKSAIDQYPSRFYPIMNQADVRMEAVEQITGSIGHTSIKMNPIYLKNGFNVTENAGEIFLDLVDEVGLDFPVDKSGGLTAPNMNMVAVSRFLGPIGGEVGLNPADRAKELAQKALGNFDPEAYFNQEAKILGSILLKEIIEPVDFKLDVPKDSFPQLKSQPIYPGGNTNVPPIAIETKMNWKPKLKSYEIFQVEENDKSSLTVDVKIHTDLQIPSNSTYEITGELKNFKIVLAPGNEENQFLVLHFHQLVFKTKSGQKPVIIPDISKVEFKGVLKFIDEMKDFMKKIDDSPSIDISPSGVMVNKILPIPDINIGAISMQKLVLSNQLYLPFDNNPLRFRFSISTRENPFLITVGAYGGGGFFGIALGVDGVEFLEASLEFGGVKALTIGTATGDVHLMAGIYFKKGQNTCELTGYVRCGGALAVFGVTVSVEFYLGLNYDLNSDRVWGEATLTVKVDFHFFSKSANLHCIKEFNKKDKPLDNNTLEEAQWIEYCDAFA